MLFVARDLFLLDFHFGIEGTILEGHPGAQLGRREPQKTGSGHQKDFNDRVSDLVAPQLPPALHSPHSAEED